MKAKWPKVSILPCYLCISIARRLESKVLSRLGILLAVINVYESHQARDGEESMSAQQDLMSAQQARNIPGLASGQYRLSNLGD
jgi:hypothetical protein